MVSGPIVKFVLTAALRDKLVTTFVLLLGVASSLSIFLGSATVTEQEQFAMVYSAGAMRFLGAICVILFTCFYIRRAFESKEVEFLLSRPISRLDYVLSHAVAFGVISFVIALVISGVVLATGQPDIFGWALWGTSLLVEFVILSIVALFFSMVLSSAAGAALACFAVYALARMMGVILGISAVPVGGTMTLVLGHIVELISIFIPRLDLMGQTSWLIYGADTVQHYDVDRFASSWSRSIIENTGVIWFIVAQGIVFSSFLIVCTVFDFVRKQF
jgi:ABC-type transport system involved in multi-copper enzyme maturation permease subunit